ncbi:MAG: diacylglycerol kinase family lipid kinase [Actinomycetota bacterium]|nr:diacylglycerol kinase family lipid kinase [Actinomycetota bacterium]
MSAERSHVLIVNPASGGGRGESRRPKVERALRSRGLDFRTVITRSLEHGVGEAISAHDAGLIPVVLSGDGLVGQIGGALAEKGATVGLIPGGRGNDLARVLGIPDDPRRAVDVLAAGAVREIDVGEINGRRFLCIASMGFDSDANRIANETKLIRGNLVYAYAALRALVAWKPATFTVTYDGAETVEVTGYAIAAANNRSYGGGMLIAPDAELDDGLFDVVTTGQIGKLRHLADLPRVFNGTYVNQDGVSVRRATTLAVSADRAFAVYADGEHVSDLPAKLRVLNRALGVIAPAAGTAS